MIQVAKVVFFSVVLFLVRKLLNQILFKRQLPSQKKNTENDKDTFETKYRKL